MRARDCDEDWDGAGDADGEGEGDWNGDEADVVTAIHTVKCPHKNPNE